MEKKVIKSLSKEAKEIKVIGQTIGDCTHDCKTKIWVDGYIFSSGCEVICLDYYWDYNAQFTSAF